jgi:hypothetical protein
LFLIPIVYVASIPPLAWLDESGFVARGTWQWQLAQVYVYPWVALLENTSDPVQRWLWRYTLWLAPNGWSP